MYAVAEAGWAIYVAAASTLAITIAIYFGERGYRYKRMKENKHVGTYGFNFEKE